jgi:chaperonin GroEL
MVKFEEEVKPKLISGVNLIANAVETTYGPNGNNVIIRNRSGVHITKDGATVAQFVDSDDELEQLGIDVVKEIAIKTAKDVGDGTSTATILARELVNSVPKGVNPIQWQRDLKQDCEKVVDYLQRIRRAVASDEDLEKVSIISTNNDEKLGRLIAEAYIKVGKDGVVNMEESTDVEDSIVYTEGMELENGYISPYFINTDDNTCELHNVLVYISEYAITEQKQIIEVANKAIREEKSLLVFAPKIDSNVVQMLLLNKGQKLESCCVISPNFKLFRDILLQDIRNMLGSTMTCKKAIISKDSTVLSGCEPVKEKVEVEVESIRKKLASGTLSEVEQQFHKKRLANYVGGIATIMVGGYSKLEVVEKKDRVEDAICAVRAALDGGVLPGGGRALQSCVGLLDLKYLGSVLDKPIVILMRSAGISAMAVSSDAWEGMNYKTGEKGDLMTLGVIDPYYVTKVALENAVSVASLIMTNECSIINVK